MEGYLELVVRRARGGGYRWYETSSFCREAAVARETRTSGLAPTVQRIGGLATTSPTGGDGTISGSGSEPYRPSGRCAGRTGRGSAGTSRSLGRAADAAREVEALDADTKHRERLMLGLRLDEPLVLAGVADVVDMAGLDRLERLGLAEHREDALRLTARGRRLGGAATVELLEKSLQIGAIATG